MLDFVSIPKDMHHSLSASCNDFIRSKSWFLPPVLHDKFPLLLQEMQKVVIPIVPCPDQRVWCNSEDGGLSFKQAYASLYPASNQVPCGKVIWKHFVPLTKSFLVRRILHRKMPTDENLCARGCVTVSICPLCYSVAESSDHLFISCPFAQRIWSWLINIMSCLIDLSTVSSILSVSNNFSSSQASDLALATVINLISTIWYCRIRSFLFSKQPV